MNVCAFPPIALVALLLFLVTPACYGQERQVTLQEAIRIAMESNHQLRAMKHVVHAQEAEVGVARSQLLPKLGFEERATRTNNPPGVFMMKLNQERFSASDFVISSLNSPRPTSDLQTLLSLDQPLFSGRALVGLSIAKKDLSAKSEDYGRKKEETIFQVVQGYLHVQTASHYLEVTKKGVDDGQEHVRMAEVRHKNGVGLYSDVLRAKTVLTEAQQRLVTAEKRVKVAQNVLGLLLGSSDSVSVSDEKVQFPLKDVVYYKGAATARKDLKALEMRRETARKNITLAQSRYLPSIGVGGSYQMNDHSRAFGAEGESWWLMASLRWELFDGLNREYETSKARYKLAETEEHLQELKKSVAFRVTEAYLGVDEARKNSELARAALATAEEGRRLVKSRFENSLAPVIDLLDVQLSLDMARSNAVMRENEYQMAVARLAYESGTIAQDLVTDR